MKMMHAVSLAVFAAALAGCGGGEPSESDIAAAIEVGIKQQLGSMPGGMFDEDDFKLNSVKKISCAMADEGYNCDIEIDMDVPMAGNMKGTRQMRFVEGDDGWTMIPY